MKCQILFSGTIKAIITNLSAELAQRAVKVNELGFPVIIRTNQSPINQLQANNILTQ